MEIPFVVDLEILFCFQACFFQFWTYFTRVFGPNSPFDGMGDSDQRETHIHRVIVYLRFVADKNKGIDTIIRVSRVRIW